VPRRRAVIREALQNVTVIDPHCHLRPEKPSADTLADLVLYHNVWIELVSSGMGQYATTTAGLPHELADPGLPAPERVRRALPYLSNIRTTTAGLLLRWLLHDLYGVGVLSEHNLDDVCALVVQRGRDAGWQETVLRQHCRIEASITVEAGAPCTPALRKGREMPPTNLANGKQSPAAMLAAMAAQWGQEIGTSAHYRRIVEQFVARLSSEEYAFVALWPPAYMTPELADEARITRIIGRAQRGLPLSQTELGSFSYFGAQCLLDALRATPIRTIQCMVGAEVLPPHRSIPQWNDRFTHSVARLAGSFGDFHFNLTAASDAYTQDLAILAKHIPNISVAGYWWHTLYPLDVRRALEARLDAVPLNKIIAFFSDAYHSEWCYPKLKLVKQITEDVLVDRVERGWYTLDMADDIVQRLFHDNPKDIYNLTR